MRGELAPVREPATPAELDPSARPVIELRGVRARHPGAARPALDGVDLRLEPGTRVALVGASGSGKSTLVAVLQRFLEVEGGSVLVDGVDTRALRGDDVRRLVTGVTQDAHLFAATIRDNLLLARPSAGEGELRGAAARARVLGWVESLPAGWDTVLGSDGATVSGGQRKRLLLARALLADPAVLVLDEPTEGLDPDVAAAVLDEALRATRDRAVLLVTHHPLAEGDVDVVVTLDEGRVSSRSRLGH